MRQSWNYDGAKRCGEDGPEMPTNAVLYGPGAKMGQRRDKDRYIRHVPEMGRQSRKDVATRISNVWPSLSILKCVQTTCFTQFALKPRFSSTKRPDRAGLGGDRGVPQSSLWLRGRGSVFLGRTPVISRPALVGALVAGDVAGSAAVTNPSGVGRCAARARRKAWARRQGVPGPGITGARVLDRAKYPLRKVAVNEVSIQVCRPQHKLRVCQIMYRVHISGAAPAGVQGQALLHPGRGPGLLRLSHSGYGGLSGQSRGRVFTSMIVFKKKRSGFLPVGPLHDLLILKTVGDSMSSLKPTKNVFKHNIGGAVGGAVGVP